MTPLLRHNSVTDAATVIAPPTIVAFDIGEVLISEHRIWSIWAQLVGVSELTFSAVLGAAIVQGGDHHETFGHLAANVDWHALQPEHEQRLGGLQEADLYADVRGCIADIKALGLTVVLAGNQPQIRTRQLEALGLGADVIVTSDELGAEKPEPAFFERLLVHLGSDDPHAVLYVGDRIDNDVVPATISGLRVCWLRRGPWGWLQELPDDLTPDLVLEGLGELPTLLGDWIDEAKQS